MVLGVVKHRCESMVKEVLIERSVHATFDQLHGHYCVKGGGSYQSHRVVFKPTVGPALRPLLCIFAQMPNVLPLEELQCIKLTL